MNAQENRPLYGVFNAPFGQQLRRTSQRAGRLTAEGETLLQPTQTHHKILICKQQFVCFVFLFFFAFVFNFTVKLLKEGRKEGKGEYYTFCVCMFMPPPSRLSSH